MREIRTDEEKAKLYTQRIKTAQAEQDRWSKHARSWVDRYRNIATEDDFTDEGHRISTPRGLSIIDAMYSSLTAVDVEVNINPQGQGTPEQARIAEQAVGEVWREAKVSKKTREAIKDALIVGIGWIKVGYDYAEHNEIQPKDAEKLDGELEAFYDLHLKANPDSPPSPEEALAVVGDTEEVKIVDRDRVVVDYLRWKDVLWDPSALRKEDIRWIAQISYLTEGELKGNAGWREYVKKATGSYKKLEELKPDSKISYNDEGQAMYAIEPEQVEAGDDDARYAVVEYWDLSALGGTFCTFPLNGNFLLDEQTNPLGFEEDMEDRNPFVPVVTRSNPGKVRGISDMEVMEPSLKELNRYRSAILNYLERYHPKILGKAGALTQAGKEALSSRTDQFVELEATANITDLKDINPPILPTQLLDMPGVVENELKEATGVSEVMRGVFPDRKRTATETAEVVAASSARQSEKRNLVEEFYTDIAKRILHLMQTFYTSERISRMVEPDRDVVWEWSAEDITMDVDLEVVLAPKQPRDSAWREERAIKLINFVAPIIAQPALHPMARVALREMGYPEYIIREVLPSQEEQQAQQQQEAEQAASETAMQAEAQAVGAASGAPDIPGGVNGPPGDSWSEVMGPEGVYEEAAENLPATGFLPAP